MFWKILLYCLSFSEVPTVFPVPTVVKSLNSRFKHSRCCFIGRAQVIQRQFSNVVERFKGENGWNVDLMISVFKKTYPTLRYNDLLACLDNNNIAIPFLEGFHLLYHAFCIASEAPLSPVLLFSPWKNDLQQIHFISFMINIDVGAILKSSEVIVCFSLSPPHEITHRHSIASKMMTAVGGVLI